MRSVTGSVLSATPMCARALLCGSVTSATMVRFRVGVSSAEVLEFPMPTTARSVHSRRKIGMDVLRLLI